jgi:hypothetical protein
MLLSISSCKDRSLFAFYKKAGDMGERQVMILREEWGHSSSETVTQ